MITLTEDGWFKFHSKDSPKGIGGHVLSAPTSMVKFRYGLTIDATFREEEIVIKVSPKSKEA